MAFTNRRLELTLARIGLRGANGRCKVVVHAVNGHVYSYNFRPRPRDLGPRSSIIVTSTSLLVDPSKPDDAASARHRLQDLAIPVRAELGAIWAERPAWARDIVDADGAFRIELDDGAFLVLAQLDDTTYIVAGIDPPRKGIRRYGPTGDLVGEYETIREAIA